KWRFSADGGKVEFDAGFEPARIYEVIYTAKDPAVVGLGPAAVRDYIAYLKKEPHIKRAIGFGTSQSGRFLRTFLYYGFNADEQGHKVFDGVWAHVAGAGRGSFNHRFAQPSRDGHPLLNLFYPAIFFRSPTILKPTAALPPACSTALPKTGSCPRFSTTTDRTNIGAAPPR